MFVGGQFAWFIGEVRDVSDPNKSNRVRVLPFGYYDSTIEKEHLPWATVMMPNTFASMQGIGGNHQLVVLKTLLLWEPLLLRRQVSMIYL